METVNNLEMIKQTCLDGVKIKLERESGPRK